MLIGSAVGAVSEAAGVSAVSGVGVGFAPGAIVSVFCWQPMSNAAQARTQIYFFIGNTFSYSMIRGKHAARSLLIITGQNGAS